LVFKALDPDWIRIRIGLQPQTLDPDPGKMNTDPQPWIQQKVKTKTTYSNMDGRFSHGQKFHDNMTKNIPVVTKGIQFLIDKHNKKTTQQNVFKYY
jgi:hypothetical protein